MSKNLPNREELLKLLAEASALQPEVRQRLLWFIFRSEGNSVAKTCRHFNISRPTYYRWEGRFQASDLRTLEDRPKHKQSTDDEGFEARVLVEYLQQLQNQQYAAQIQEPTLVNTEPALQQRTAPTHTPPPERELAQPSLSAQLCFMLGRICQHRLFRVSVLSANLILLGVLFSVASFESELASIRGVDLVIPQGDPGATHRVPSREFIHEHCYELHDMSFRQLVERQVTPIELEICEDYIHLKQLLNEYPAEKPDSQAWRVPDVFQVARQHLVAFVTDALRVPKAWAAPGIYRPISYQGKVATSTGVTVTDGMYNFRFRIFDAATGGTQLWQETYDTGTQQVTMTGGLFTVRLGEITAMTGSVNFNTDNLFLEIQFDPDGDDNYQEVFVPRRRFTAVPYAHNADQLDGVDAAQFLRSDEDDVMTGSLLIHANGTGLGTPETELEVVGTVSGTVLRASALLASSGSLSIEGGFYQASLTDCDSATDKVIWDASTGNFTCGTESGGGGGLTEADADARYVNLSGDTMTGGLLIQNGGTPGTIEAGLLLEIQGAMSGTTLHATDLITSSGSLIVEGNITFLGTLSGSHVVVSDTFQGAGLTDCDSDTDKLIWDSTTNRFSCGADIGEGTATGTFISVTADENSTAAVGPYDAFEDASYPASFDFTTNGSNAITFTASDGRFTISEDGSYLINLTLIAERAANGLINYRIDVNGATVYDHDFFTHAVVDPVERTVTIMRDLDNGDYVEFYVNGNGSNVTINDGTTANLVRMGAGGDTLTESSADNRYVNIGGDTMTGGLLIQSGGTPGTIDAGLLLEVEGTASGTHLHAHELLTASGALSVEGDTILQGNLLATTIEGAGLSDCDTAYSKIIYDAGTRQFACSTDQDSASGAELVMAQYADGTGNQDINVAAPVVINWDDDLFSGTGVTRTGDQINLVNPGFYRITYSVSHQNTNSARKILRCQARMNGATTLEYSTSYSYSRTATEEFATNTAVFIVETTVADEYYEILCNGEGSGIGTQAVNTVQNQSWTIAEGLSAVVGGAGGGGAGGDLQGAYDADSDGFDAVITLTGADDSIQIVNPSTGGTDSTTVFTIDNQATGVVGLDISSVSTAAADAALRLSTAGANHILFGSGGSSYDTNLYRVGANLLGTDDGFQIGGNLNLNTVDGGGLSDCDTATSKLIYDAGNRRFSCSTESAAFGGGSGAYISVTVDENSNASAAPYDVFEDGNYPGGTIDFVTNASNTVTYTPADGRFTVNATGAYLITFNLVSIKSGNSLTDIFIDVNGATVYQYDVFTHSVVDPNERTFTIVQELNAGDFVEFSVDSLNANTITVQDGTSASIVLLSNDTGGGGGGGGGGSDTLQDVYDNDVDGFNAVITLSSADDSVEILNPVNGGTDEPYVMRITNNTGSKIGLEIVSVSGSASDAGLRISTQGANHILFGSGGISYDTNLYRSAANTLRTDDALSVGGNIVTDGNMSGDSLTVSSVANCDDLSTDAQGNLQCGTSLQLFDAYDGGPATAITNVEATLNIDTTRRSDAAYTLAADEVTFNQDGVYLMTARLTAVSNGAGGGTRTNVTLRFEQDVTGAFVDVPGSECQDYVREQQGGVDHTASCSVTWVAAFNNGDRVRLRHQKNTATTAVNTVPNQSSLMIQQLSGNSGADIAELYYTLDPEIGAGDIVSIDSALEAGVRKSRHAYDAAMLGVVSTNPGVIMGLEDPYGEGRPVLLALAGRIPVKVTTENGPIAAGDLITSSSIPGVGMKATEPGSIVGKALNGYDGEGIGYILLFIENGYFGGAGDLFIHQQSGSTLQYARPAAITVADGTALQVENTTSQGVGIDIVTNLSSGAGLQVSTQGAPHITFGSGGQYDVSLFRGAADVLQTEDLFKLTAEDHEDRELLVIDTEETSADQSILRVTSDVGEDERTVYQVTAGGDVYADGTLTTSGKGYAQWFTAGESDLQPGELVCVHPESVQAVRRCQGLADPNVIGVVTDDAAVATNADADRVNQVLVALLGQVSVRLSASGGSLSAGDALTSSWYPGLARRAEPGEPTVAIALEYADADATEVTALLMRRNGSLTVSDFEEQILQSVTALDLDEEVQNLVDEAVTVLDLNEDVSAEVQAQLQELDLAGQIAAIRAEMAALAAERPLFALNIVDDLHVGGQITLTGSLTALGGLRASTLETTSTLAVGTDARVAGDLYLEGSLVAPDLFVAGALSTDGGLTVGSALQANTLALSSGATIHGQLRTLSGAQILGQLQAQDLFVDNALQVVGAVTIQGLTRFLSDVEIHGQLTVSARQAGHAVITQSGMSVTMAFDPPFTVEPVVNATADTPVLFAVSQTTLTGFTISVAEPAMSDITFAWLAIGRQEFGTGTVLQASLISVETDGGDKEDSEESEDAEESEIEEFDGISFYVDEHGVPISDDELFNAFIRGQTPLDPDGTPYRNQYYLGNQKWQRPEFPALEFTYTYDQGVDEAALADKGYRVVIQTAEDSDESEAAEEGQSSSESSASSAFSDSSSEASESSSSSEASSAESSSVSSDSSASSASSTSSSEASESSSSSVANSAESSSESSASSDSSSEASESSSSSEASSAESSSVSSDSSDSSSEASSAESNPTEPETEPLSDPEDLFSSDGGEG